MTDSPLPRTILFDLYGTLVPEGSRLQRDALAFQMAEVLGVDRIKFADIVQSTFDARVRGTMGGFSETISELARRVGGCPHVRASCIGRGTASDILQEVAERYVFGAALDQPKVAGLPTWHRHGLFSGNAVVVDLNVAEGRG